MIANLKTLLDWYRQHPSTELRSRIIDEWLSTLTIPPEIKTLLEEELSETRRKYVCTRCGQATD